MNDASAELPSDETVPSGAAAHAPVLRLLDASGNRAREALRVLEDYARFILNHAGLSESLKQLRHDLAAATSPWDAAGMVSRDVAGDVGTDIKTADEFHRDNAAAVVTAAGKRLGEALRSLEEFGKVLSPAAAGQIERLRYEFYAVEQQLQLTLRPVSRFATVRLYVLITESACRRPWLEVAADAIAGGADCLQLREKELDSGEFLRRAKQLVALCRQHDVLCIINDRPDIALLSHADGVHVGQDDLPAIEVRKLLGPGKIIGVSTHAIAHAEQAVLDGADYLGLGPVFPSPTKPRNITPGLPYAHEAAGRIRIPLVAIAGITETNLDAVLATGVRAVAVTAAVSNSENVREAAKRLKTRLSGDVPSSSSVGQTFLSVTATTVGRTSLSAAGTLVGRTFLSATGEGTPSPLPRPMTAGRVPPSPADKNVCPTGDLLIHRRRLRHWQLTGATYFITFRVAASVLSEPERLIVLQHLRSGHGKFYDLLGAVVMPDHAHAILQPLDGCDLPRILKGIKGVSARLVNESRQATGTLWQDQSFDRIIRDQAELGEKLQYIVNNPVKRELTKDPWAYEALYVSPGTD